MMLWYERQLPTKNKKKKEKCFFCSISNKLNANSWLRCKFYVTLDLFFHWKYNVHRTIFSEDLGSRQTKMATAESEKERFSSVACLAGMSFSVSCVWSERERHLSLSICASICLFFTFQGSMDNPFTERNSKNLLNTVVWSFYTRTTLRSQKLGFFFQVLALW